MTTSLDWGSVAPAWDQHRRHAGTSTAPVSEALLTAAAPHPGDAVLELACGTGDLARQLAERVGADGQVLATDYAPAMVSLAAAALINDPQASTAVVDAAATGLAPESYSAVICAMGLMFLPDPTAALKDWRRVLVPGGRLAIAVWAGPGDNLWVASLGMSAAMNGLAVGGPPTGPGGLFSLSDPEVLAQAATDAGFTDVHIDQTPLSFRYGSTDEHFDIVSSLAGPLATLLASANQEQRDAVRATCAELLCGQVATDGSLRLAGLALILSARP